MRISRISVAFAALLIAASCAPQTAPSPAAPTQAATGGTIPFQVPEGALFVARTSRATTVYRIQEGCAALGAMNPDRVVFYWTLEAAERAGFKLSDDAGCS